jgi:CelD/BcsL family acetyltransferase involved in cellulose biosynthesis
MIANRGGDRPPHFVLERVHYEPAAWDAIVAGHKDAEVYHSSAWLKFLAASQGAEPVVAVVRADGRPVGHVVGAIARRLGFRILGSPMRGWTTQCMGFLLEADVDRRAAAKALLPFAFRDLGCVHVELADRSMTVDQMSRSGYCVETGQTFVVELDQPEEAIFRRMRSTTRNYIRQAVRRGLVVEQATEASFADEYHAQLVDVFAQQGLVPTYHAERVRHLIHALQPTGQLLLLGVRDPSGTLLATLVTVAGRQTAVLWGAAFLRSMAAVHPNEMLHWEAIRHWRAAGVSRYDMGGGGDYKAKYGGVVTPTVHFYRSRWAVLGVGRSAVRRLFRARQVVFGARRRPVSARDDRVDDG